MSDDEVLTTPSISVWAKIWQWIKRIFTLNLIPRKDTNSCHFEQLNVEVIPDKTPRPEEDPAPASSATAVSQKAEGSGSPLPLQPISTSETQTTETLPPKPIPAPLEPQVEPSPPAVAEWKVLEPQDQNDRVEHETCQLKKGWNGWSTLAASVRGKLHAHKALWREDAYAFDQVDNWTILVVSDGAGSAKLSRVGARICCDESLKALRELLEGYQMQGSPEAGAPPNAALKQLKAFLVFAACSARDGVVSEARQRQVPESELSATLLLLVHTFWKGLDVIGTIQIGDGAIGVYTNDGKCTLVGVPDHGEYSSETVFVTSWKQLIEKPYDQRVLFAVKKDVLCIAAMCDGVSDDFFPEDKRLIELFNGDPIQEMKGKNGEPVRGVLLDVLKDPKEGKALVEWLRYEKKGSSDDRTLVLMYKA